MQPPDRPLVSVITPSYNQAYYLEVCIQSVLEQDYEPIEYLLYDGGSTDGSREIVEKYALLLAHWETGKDLGQADAINKGLRRARGEFVAWLNSDDAYLPGTISQAVDALTREPEVGMVYGDGLMVDSGLKLLDPHRYRQLDLTDLLSFEVILQPATFMRRSVLEAAGYLDTDYHLILDHELWVRMAARAPIRHVPQFWALERTHGAAKTIARAGDFVVEARRMLDQAQRDPSLSDSYEQAPRRIEAGFHVFSARRLIDAGPYRQAALHLIQAARLHPITVARYWYKVLQAFGSAFGFDWLFIWYRSLRRRLQFRGAIIRPDLPAPVDQAGRFTGQQR